MGIIAVAIALTLLFAPASCAETNTATLGEAVDVLKPIVHAVKEDHTDLSKALDKRLKEIIKKNAKRTGLSGSVSIALSGNEAPQDEKYDLDTKIEFAKGQYPRQLRVRARAKFSDNNGDISEDVRALLINFDYYGSEHLEMFVFTERFTDSFMSIAERYEVGTGILWEMHLFAHRPDDQTKRFRESMRDIQQQLASLPEATFVRTRKPETSHFRGGPHSSDSLAALLRWTS